MGKKLKVKSLKPFSLVVIILFILLAVGAYLFREAIFWKTYVNEELGFSFKYPASWEVTEGTRQKEVGSIKKLGSGFFEIDKQKNRLPDYTSSGNVQLWLFNPPTAYKVWLDQGFIFNDVEINGFVWKHAVPKSTVTTHGNLLFTRDMFLNKDDFEYHLSTRSVSHDKGFYDKLLAKYYFWVGSRIVNSLRFDK